MPVLGFHIDSGQGHLDTSVAYRTDVGHHCTATRLQRQGYRVEQILRSLLVHIDATVDAAAEEAEVNTGVVFCRSLPLQILVHDA